MVEIVKNRPRITLINKYMYAKIFYEIKIRRLTPCK